MTNTAYRENCGKNRRTIFAVKNGGEIQIAAGCFLDNLGKFERAVDRGYEGEAAEEYKLAARDCVRELTEKLNAN